MNKVLFISDTTEEGLPNASLEALTAAKTLADELKTELVVGLFGEKVEQAVGALSGCAPSKVFGVEGADFGQSRYATDALAMEKLCQTAQAEVVVSPSNSRISRTLAGVAFRLGGRVDTHVTGFSVTDGKLSVKRWYYKQRMEAEQTRAAKPWFLSVDSGNFASSEKGGSSVNVELLAVEASDANKRTNVEGFKTPSADQQTIRPDADLLFVAGAGWTKKQSDGNTHVDKAANLILDFLKKSSSSLGGSKSVVDLGGEGQAVLPFMTHLNQVGQTGASPRHPKGLATCCHGEEPHVIGWRFIKERRAINANPNCGWAQGKADVLYVADAFEVMAKVNELLS